MGTMSFHGKLSTEIQNVALQIVEAYMLLVMGFLMTVKKLYSRSERDLYSCEVT